ncbi:hypothetical protein [Streptomyces sp. SAJ15]|uniref:hypothetical protein n=1 Tax=Streptomyces sp. SAJ15 TaxID=2011095 RepID=UPI0016429C85|nr:hypothetical protein [Streptomyces sp. SAJ15]
MRLRGDGSMRGRRLGAGAPAAPLDLSVDPSASPEAAPLQPRPGRAGSVALRAV